MKKLMENVISELQGKRAEGDLIFSSNKSLKMSAQKGMISDYKVSSSHLYSICESAFYQITILYMLL